jgi:hypothetical protein
MGLQEDTKVVMFTVGILAFVSILGLGVMLYVARDDSEPSASEEAIQRFDKTLKESLKECTDKYQLTMVLQERNEACERGMVVLEEELNSCLNGSLYGTDK